MSRWPHQLKGVSEVIRHIGIGTRRICLTSPTGGGKSRMMIDLTEWASAQDWPVVLYTPRRMLTQQLAKTFREHGIPFGVRAANFDEELRLEEPVQIASPATEDARCFKKVRWQPHNAKLVLIDEIHLQKGDVIRRIIDWHMAHGAFVVVVTATPIGISDMADVLIVAGTNRELRDCGALLPCIVYGCEEIDTTKIKTKKNGEFSYSDVKAIWPTEIFGHVVAHWNELNPEHKPAILFAPGVAESIWFAEKFRDAGHRWAHIDGEDCWLDGEFFRSDREMRDRILKMSELGEIQGVCNRFVMREGIDMPWLYHEILATPIGSMVSYVQTVGRLLRAHPSLTEVILQDHGGNWWRHGSPNQNRDWSEYWTAPEHYAAAVREERMRSKKEPEPIHCPQCDAIRLQGDSCPKCGYRHTTKSRIVIQHNGQLKEMQGDIFKPRRVKMMPNTQEIWTACYHRMKNAKGYEKTWRQVEGLFFYENHYYPPRDLLLMPKKESDWFRGVKSVPQSDLTGVPERKSQIVNQPEPALFN